MACSCGLNFCLPQFSLSLYFSLAIVCLVGHWLFLGLVCFSCLGFSLTFFYISGHWPLLGLVCYCGLSFCFARFSPSLYFSLAFVCPIEIGLFLAWLASVALAFVYFGFPLAFVCLIEHWFFIGFPSIPLKFWMVVTLKITG